MENEKRDFKGIWIPKEVWFDRRITAVEKMVLMEIDSLDCTERGCCASNEYLANVCQCSISKISKAISRLVDLQYIYVADFDGRVRFLKSRVVKNDTLHSKICEQSKIVESNGYSKVDRYIDNSKNTTDLIELTKARKKTQNPENNQHDDINKNFEILWKMLPSTQYDRKSTITIKRKKELFEMGEKAIEAINLYVSTSNPQYYYRRDRFLNEIIGNYIDKTEKDFLRSEIKNNVPKSELENCYSALSKWANQE